MENLPLFDANFKLDQIAQAGAHVPFDISGYLGSLQTPTASQTAFNVEQASPFKYPIDIPQISMPFQPLHQNFLPPPSWPVHPGAPDVFSTPIVCPVVPSVPTVSGKRKREVEDDETVGAIIEEGENSPKSPVSSPVMAQAKKRRRALKVCRLSINSTCSFL